jgi:dihydroorotate dehydrogenase
MDEESPVAAKSGLSAESFQPRRIPVIYRAFFRLVLQRISSEGAHALAERTMRTLAWIPGFLQVSTLLLGTRDKTLEVKVNGLSFRAPLGVAAGMDKNAKWFDPLMALGFGFVEVGTATAQPQAGNQEHKSVVSRLPKDRALINAMGFPNDGAEAMAARLTHRRVDGVLGVNIGKTKCVALDDAIPDYRESARILAPVADYLALNVSSPNTPGLRDLQSVERLTALIQGVREQLREDGFADLPMMIKLGPDLADEEIERLADMALRLELAGIIAVNTTTDYSAATRSEHEIEVNEHGGGLSGAPLRERAFRVLEIIHARTDGKLPLISVGGIESSEDAWARILAGATLLQAHTAFVYQGPLWAHRMNRGIARLLHESEWSTLMDAVGKGPDPVRTAALDSERKSHAVANGRSLSAH